MDIKKLQADFLLHTVNIPQTEKAMMERIAEEFEELKEAVEQQKRHFSTENRQIKDTIEEEMYDVFYFILQLANLYGVNFEEVISAKYQHNQSKYND